MLAFDRALMDRDRVALDRAAVSARTFDADGRMHVAGCRISKANVCGYYGREIPDYKKLGLDAAKLYMLYRDPEELAKAAHTFRNVQLLMPQGHTKAVKASAPNVPMTVGTIGSGITFDGTYLVADQLTVWTREGIDLIESEDASELSSAYHYRVEMTPGRTPDGVAFDGRMRDIKGNHVALVREGRAGSDVFVNDALPSESHTMKRPHLLARLIALGVVTAPADDAARLALDTALCGMTAKDADPDDDSEDDPENPGKRRKKMNPGPGRAGSPGGALASDEAVALAVDKAIKSKGYVTTAEAQTMATDAANKARTEAVAEVNALHVARDAVRPLVGVVALDSAAAVYKFALTKEGVALDGVHESAFPALVAQRVALKTASVTPVKAPPQFAADAATAAANALPGLGRIAVG